MRNGYTFPEDLIRDRRNVYKIRGQCYTFGGKYVKLVPPQGFDVNRFAPPRIYGPREELPNGFYTYFFPSEDRIICVPVKNKFEVGANHFTLALLSEARKVIAAGELYVEGNTITFNLLSGSFMKEWMMRKLESKCDNELSQLTTELLKRQYPDHTIRYTNSEILTEENIPVTREELDRYVEMGVEVRLYDSEEACNANTASLEAMVQQKQNVLNHPRFAPTGQAKTNLETEINDLQKQIRDLNKYDTYPPRPSASSSSSGGKRRKSRRRLQKRRKTRRL